MSLTVLCHFEHELRISDIVKNISAKNLFQVSPCHFHSPFSLKPISGYVSDDVRAYFFSASFWFNFLESSVILCKIDVQEHNLYF